MISKKSLPVTIYQQPWVINVWLGMWAKIIPRFFINGTSNGKKLKKNLDQDLPLIWFQHDGCPVHY